MLKINGVVVRSPREFEVEISDIDGGRQERNARGSYVLDRIAVKRKLDVTWTMLSQTEMSAILTQILNVSFTIEYPDPALGVTTKTFVTKKRSSPKSLIMKGAEVMWDELSCTFEER